MASHDPQPPGSQKSFWSRFWVGRSVPMKPQPPDHSPEPQPTSPEEMMPAFDDSTSSPPPFAIPIIQDQSVTELPSLHSRVNDEMALAKKSTVEMPITQQNSQAEINLCPVCQTMRSADRPYCSECGWQFPIAVTEENSSLSDPELTLPIGQLIGRYEIIRSLSCRPGIKRFLARSIDANDIHQDVLLLVGLHQAPTEVTHPEADPRVDIGQSDTSRDSSTIIQRESAVHHGTIKWPSLQWEKQLLLENTNPHLPRVLDQFTQCKLECLVLEIAKGRSFWDAWDDLQTPMQKRIGWLITLAETLHQLHLKRGIIEGLRPELIVINEREELVLADLSDLLPLPLPDNAPIKANYYTAPELILFPNRVDARADLYGFGAMLYALHLGRELTEMDFEMHGVAKPFIDRFPDAHPLMARIVMKTLAREVNRRFPTEDHADSDPTGFQELISVLRTAASVMDRVRLEIGCWTSTGLVRSGNEDAFAVFRSCQSRQDELHDQALILLTDGMGGCEAGEVASALAIDTLKDRLLNQQPFQSLVHYHAESAAQWDHAAILSLLVVALTEANRVIYEAARNPLHRHHGMGCTAEVVYIDGRHMYIAHVGDSRTYHYSQGQLKLITRDQTLVYRLVELGHLTEYEAMHHPRRNELQQALGGLSIVEPLTYHVELAPGDAILICTDGLNNHVDHECLCREIAKTHSAEHGARRLVNLANLNDGNDNTTVVLIRLS